MKIKHELTNSKVLLHSRPLEKLTTVLQLWLETVENKSRIEVSLNRMHEYFDVILND